MGRFFYFEAGCHGYHPGHGRESLVVSPRVLCHTDVVVMSLPEEDVVYVDLAAHVRDPGTRRMLVFRQGPLGDAILGFVLTRTLARAFPSIEWHYLTSRAFLPLFKGPGVSMPTRPHEGQGLSRMALVYDVPFVVSCHHLFELDHEDGRAGFRFHDMLEAFGVRALSIA